MPSIAASNPFSKWRVTYIFALLSVFAGLCSYGWYIFTLVQEAQAFKPQPQIERLLKDFLTYHQQTKQFPANFSEINARLWRTIPTPNYGKDACEARTKNYYYRLTKVNPDTCALWALPTGPQRQYAAAFFLVITPDWARVWKGKARAEQDAATLPAIPSQVLLVELGMQELPARIFKPTAQKLP